MTSSEQIPGFIDVPVESGQTVAVNVSQIALIGPGRPSQGGDPIRHSFIYFVGATDSDGFRVELPIDALRELVRLNRP